MSSWLETVWQFSCGIVLVAALLAIVARYLPVGLIGIVVLIVAGPALREPLLPPSVTVGIQLTLASGLLIGLLGRVVANPRLVHASLLLGLVLLALWSLSTARGAHDYGAMSALRESFVWFPLFTVLFAAGSMPSSSRMLLPTWFAASAFLSVLALYGILTTGFASSAAKVVQGGMLVDSRPVTAVGALLVGQAAIIAGTRSRRSRWSVALVLCFATMSILLQHRTVWAALGVAVVVVVAANSAQLLPRFAPLLFISPVIGIAIIGSGGGSRIRTVLDESWQNAFSPRSSLHWRVDGWRQLLGRNKSAGDWLLGRPFGEGFSRVVNGQLVTFSPHSLYVELLIRMGVVSGLLVILLWFFVLRDCSLVAGRLGLRPSAIPALIITQAIFAVSYRLDAAQVLLLGILLAQLGKKALGTSSNPGNTVFSHTGAS